MKIEKDTPSGKYSFQNIVIPNRYLAVNWQNIEAEQEEIRKPNASLIRSTTFEGTVSGIQFVYRKVYTNVMYVWTTPVLALCHHQSQLDTPLSTCFAEGQ